MIPHPSRILPRLSWVAALCSLALLVGGCYNPFVPRVASNSAPVSPAPTPNSAANVLKLFQWCWRNRAINEYREIFTDDYEFKFSQRDSAGGILNGEKWLRENEITSAEKLFVTGTASDPPASNITFDYTSDLVAFDDAREGKNPKWHKQIRAQVYLRITVGESVTDIAGPGLFYLVRGDSAVIPQELKDRGFLPDSNRWWISRWEDETVGGAGLVANTDGVPHVVRTGAGFSLASRGARPASAESAQGPISWGMFKYRYLGLPAPGARANPQGKLE